MPDVTMEMMASKTGFERCESATNLSRNERGSLVTKSAHRTSTAESAERHWRYSRRCASSMRFRRWNGSPDAMKTVARATVESASA